MAYLPLQGRLMADFCSLETSRIPTTRDGPFYQWSHNLSGCSEGDIMASLRIERMGNAVWRSKKRLGISNYRIKFWNRGQGRQSSGHATIKCNYPFLRFNQIDSSVLPRLSRTTGTCKTPR